MTAAKTTRRANLRLDAAKVEALHRLGDAVRQSGNGEAIVDAAVHVANAVEDLTTAIRPLPTEELVDKLGDIMDSAYLQDLLLEIGSRFGWAFEVGRKFAQEDKNWEGTPYGVWTTGNPPRIVTKEGA